MRRPLDPIVWIWIIVGVFLLIIAVLIVLVVRAEKKWEQYKVDHHCQQTGETKLVSETRCHTTSNGSMVCLPQMVEKAQWACDEEEIVWR